MSAQTSHFSSSSSWILGIFSANTASRVQPSAGAGTKKPDIQVEQCSEEKVDCRIISGHDEVLLGKIIAWCVDVSATDGSPGNLHCSMFPANKTMSLFHRACMIERNLAAAIYKWLDDCNLQSSDLSSPTLFDGNPFTCLFEKFECESELEISNGLLNSPTLNQTESLLDKVT